MKETFLQLDQALIDLIDPETGEILEGYEEVALKKEDKIKGIAKYVLYSEAQIKAMKEHIDTVTERMKSAVKNIENTKNFIKNKMLEYDITKIEMPECVISIPKPLPSLIGDDSGIKKDLGIDVIEEELREKKGRLAEIKKDIKERLKKDEEVEGFHLEYKTKLKIS